MPECKLAIVHLAGHHDPTLIETLWREIIDQGTCTTYTVILVVKSTCMKM